MRERQSNNYGGPTNVFLSSESKRTRPKIGACSETDAGTSAVGFRKQKTIVGQLRETSSRCKNATRTGLDEASVSFSGRGQRIPFKRKSRESEKEDMDLKELEIGPTFAADFRSTRINSMSKCAGTCIQGNGKDKKNCERTQFGRTDATVFTSRRADSTSKHARTHTQGLKGVSLEDHRKGNKKKAMGPENTMFGRIDAAEFRRKTSHYAPKHARSDTKGNKNKVMPPEKADFRNKRADFTSKMGVPRGQELYEGFSAPTFLKNFNRLNAVPCAGHHSCSSPMDANQYSHEEYNNQRVSAEHDEEDLTSIENERVKFMKGKNRWMENRVPSTKEKSIVNNGAPTGRRDVVNVSKKVPSASFGRSLHLKNHCRGSAQERRKRSSSIGQIGNDGDDVAPKEIGIKNVYKAKFSNKKAKVKSKTGLPLGKEPTESHSVASASRNIYDACNNIFSSNRCIPLFVKEGYADQLPGKTPLRTTGISRSEFKASKLRSSSKQEVDNRRTKVVLIDSSPSSLKDVSRDSDENLSDNDSNPSSERGIDETEFKASSVGSSSKELPVNCCGSPSSVETSPRLQNIRECVLLSSPENGNNNEDTDVEMVENFDFSMFRNKKKQFVATSTENNNKRKRRSFTKKNDGTRKKGRFSYLRKGKTTNLNVNPGHVASNGSVQYMNYASSSDDADAFVEEYKFSSLGLVHESDLGIASRTRSKKWTTKKQLPEADTVALDSEGDSDSFTDGKISSSDDEFQVENSFQRKVQVVSNAISSEQIKGQKTCKSYEVLEENMSSILPHDAKEMEGSKQRDGDKNVIMQTIVEPLHSVPQLNQCDNVKKGYDGGDDVINKNEENPMALDIEKKTDNVESLLAELDSILVSEFNNTEVDLDIAPAEETQHERCSRGKHELYLEDDQGLTCIYCLHVELGPKDVLPQFVENIYYKLDEKQAYGSSSFAEEGNNEKVTDIEHVEIGRVDRSVARDRGGQSSVTSGENEKREVFACSGKGESEDLSGSLCHASNTGFVECMISEPSRPSNGKNAVSFQEKNKISSSSSGIDSNLRVANRTRSKIGTVNQSSEDAVTSDLVDDSGSFTDKKINSVCNASHLDSHNMEILGSQGVEPEAQSCTVLVASQKTSTAKHVSKGKRLSNLQNSITKSGPQMHLVASSEQIKRRKISRPCQVHKEKENSNRVPHDTNEYDGLKMKSGEKGDNVLTLTLPKHSDPQINSDEVDTAIMLAKDQVQEGTNHQNLHLVCLSHSNDGLDKIDDSIKNDDRVLDEKEMVLWERELKRLINGKQVPSKRYDLCKILADSLLERDKILAIKEHEHEHPSLPLRFRFEEEPNEGEKSEWDEELESLFSELDFNWALEELGSFNCPKADQETYLDDESQHSRCARGIHELVVEDDLGLICIYCHYVALGPKDVLPQWAEKAYREKKKYYATDELLDFDALELRLSTDKFSDLCYGAGDTVWSVKPGVRETMYQHQQEGFEFLWKNLAGGINIAELMSRGPCEVGGCIISHAPGTGKTRLTIVFIETYLKLFPDSRPMIIAPASMLLTWEEEFRKWNVEFPFYNLNHLDFVGKEDKTALNLLAGSKRQNLDAVRMVKIFSWHMGRSILGISYSLFEKLTGEKYLKEKTNKQRRLILNEKIENLRKILLEKPGVVVLDEGHTPRNQRSNIWNVLLKLKTERRVILSGTPFQNNFAELFNTLRLVRPAMANTLAQEKTIAEMITSKSVSKKFFKGESSSQAIDRAAEKLKISMTPFVHVHKGTILQQSLPGLRDCVILLKPPALQRSLIDRLEGLPSTFKFEHDIALISVHPHLYKHCDSTKEKRSGIDMEAVEQSKLNPNEGVKTRFIMEFVRLCVNMNEKVLIFSQYIQPLELIKEHLKEVFKWIIGKQILQLQGKLDQKQRQILINIFNDPQSESKIMLASTKCCSEGISLVGASRVILLDVVWNPSVERQAICRAYRIGQKKFVHTYHLMTSGTTEADKYCRQVEKERLSELVFTSSSNEITKRKNKSVGIEDRILEIMVEHANLKEMFEKIINQPKETNLIESFGL